MVRHKEEKSVKIKREPNITEEGFRLIYRGHEGHWFDFTLAGEDEHLYGHIVAHDTTSNDPPTTICLYISEVYPHLGDPRSDPTCHRIPFNTITGIRRLPKAEAA